MDTPHGKIIEENEYSIVYDEDFIVSDTRLITVYLAIFSHCCNLG